MSTPFKLPVKLPRRGSQTEDGQILIIFAFAFIAIIMMLALLFDGAQALVLRRQMQDASDAAALAGANLIQGLAVPGCSATVGNPPGPPQAAIVAAAKASIAANLPNYPPANVVVTCPLGWDDGQGHTPAVQVQLFQHAPTFFGSIFGTGPLNVATRGAAVNGQNARNAYSVILLDTSVPSWPQARRGCPSFLLSGGPTVTFDSSVYIDSACTAVNGGALSTNGNSASLTLGANGPTIRIVGEYKPQALTITPTPLQHQSPKPDPLAPPNLLPPPGSPNFATNDLSSLKVIRTTKLTLNNSTQTLEPGVYKGGIQLKNSSIAYLHPGIYVFQGGGLDLGAQSSVYAVPAGVVPANIATTWATTCTNSNCGVLLYNTGDASGGNAMGRISIGAGATFKVRSYDPTASVTLLNNGTTYTNQTYNNILIWQTYAPAETASYEQPWLLLNGGGSVVMAGTVYAPQAKVQMGGNAGGSGGSSITLTLQFIVWDLELSGNSKFHFVYSGDEFATPLDYGLMQ
ncbi:MAG: pilus assembly protein TadG-related protein [Chloroflexota bacterium]|nr:pilus assembly protein TadG-related protein [Chloroflexota bacterium]